MQTTTPTLNNIAPQTGRMVNEENEIHNVVDDYGMLKIINPEAVYVHEGKAFNFSFVGSISICLVARMARWCICLVIT